MGTVPKAPAQFPWCVEAKVGAVLRAADITGDQADPTAALVVEAASKFKTLCGRNNVLSRVRPDLVTIFTEANANGCSFPDEWPGKPFTFHNIR